MKLGDELAYVSAAELAGRIRRRELSPVEVVEAAIGRVEERNSSLNAFIYLGFEEARQRAQADYVLAWAPGVDKFVGGLAKRVANAND